MKTYYATGDPRNAPGYNRGEVALRAKALSTQPPTYEALRWVWCTFTFKLVTVLRHSNATTMREVREFEREIMSMLAEAWGMEPDEFDMRCQGAAQP